MTTQPAAPTAPPTPLPAADDPRWHAPLIRVAPKVHRFAHPSPIPGCLVCNPDAEPVDASSETHWRTVAARRPNWGGKQ